jgi:hypothetical protein
MKRFERLGRNERDRWEKSDHQKDDERGKNI